MCSKLSIARQLEAPQELLSLFSYLSVLRFSINFSEDFRLLLDGTFELIKTSSEQHGNIAREDL